MSPVLIALLGLLAVSGSQELTSRNYNGLENYVQGFMDGYLDTRARLPSQCLSTSKEEQLDEDIIAVFSTILRQKWEEFPAALQDVLNDLVDAYHDCGLDVVYQNFNQDVVDKGLLWVFTNFFLHFFEIEGYFTESAVELLAENYKTAGSKLGKMFALIAPPKDN